MIDFEDNFEQYLKHLDLVQKNEPEKYELIKEVADSFKDIHLSKIIENIALSVEKYKTEYSKITSNAFKEVFLKEQIELYAYANIRSERYGDYANQMFDKYQPVFIEALEYWIKELNNLKALPHQPIAKQNDKLSDLITHQKSVEIVEGIKIRYKNIKGKRLKLLLLALQELNLLPNERIAQKFYDCCKAEFGWDVASYTAMNDYKFNERVDKLELDNMKKFLEEIIQTK